MATKIKTTALTMTNMQAMVARNAIRQIGEANGKNRAQAEKLARIGLFLDAKVHLYEVTRRNLIRSNAVRGEDGEIVYVDSYKQNACLRWELQGELADLDNETVSLRVETLTVDELGDSATTNLLISLAPLLVDLVGEESTDKE